MTITRNWLRAIAVVLFIVVLASVIRLWGLGWGALYLHHPDEPIALETAQTMVRDRDINPHFFHWSSLPSGIQATTYSAYVGVGMLAGDFDGPADITPPQMQALGSGHLANPMTVTVGRLTTIAFSLELVMLALWFTSRVARRIWISASHAPWLRSNRCWRRMAADSQRFGRLRVGGVRRKPVRDLRLRYAVRSFVPQSPALISALDPPSTEIDSETAEQREGQNTEISLG